MRACRGGRQESLSSTSTVTKYSTDGVKYRIYIYMHTVGGILDKEMCRTLEYLLPSDS